VKNPLRSEAEAFHFLLGAVVYFGAIALAGGLGGRWWGLGVFVVLTAAVVWWWLQARRREPPARADDLPETPPGVHRVLVVADETLAGRALRAKLKETAARGRLEVLVVAPALAPPVQHWVSDEDEARAEAQRRLDDSLEHLRSARIPAHGEVGDSEPLQAIEDALRTFGADEIVISTHPPGRSHWLEQGLPEEARTRFRLPVTHVVVDLDGEREQVG
jgi:hypothetical protein